jgi:hypothetical protein
VPPIVRLFRAPSLRAACLALLTVSACVQHRPVGTAAPISRRIPIAGDTITLGTRWANVARHTKSPLDTTIALADGSSVGADGIVVSCSPDGVVRKITFMYATGRDFDAVLSGLRTRFGSPTDSGRVRTTNSQREIWIWRDGRTEFTYFHLTSTRSTPSGMGVLSDLSTTTAPREGVAR